MIKIHYIDRKTGIPTELDGVTEIKVSGDGRKYLCFRPSEDKHTVIPIRDVFEILPS